MKCTKRINCGQAHCHLREVTFFSLYVHIELKKVKKPNLYVVLEIEILNDKLNLI